MSSVDVIIIVLYLIGMLVIGFAANRRQHSLDDYYVAGRSLGSLPIACLWVSSWIGGASVVGSSSRAYDFGISGIWYVASIAVGLIIFALTFPAIIKRVGDRFMNLTYPDMIEARYGSAARIISTVTTILAFIAHVAGQFVAAGSMLHVITDWDLKLCFIVAAAITTIYTSVGGYIAVTYTDLAQVGLLIAGVALFGVPFATSAVMDGSSSFAELPASYFDLGAMGWPTIAAMCLSIVFSFYTCMDSYTRCFAAKDTKSARNGALLALIGVVLIAGASTYLGMSAKVLLPDLASSSDSITALILQTFPSGIRGFVLVGILAAIMSTGDICLLTVSANITQDIYHRYINPKADDKKLLRLGVVATFCVGLLATFFAWFMNDVVDILVIAFTINSAGLFLPTICGMVWKKANSRATVISMSLSLIAVLVWFVADRLGCGGIFAMDPLWPGLVVSVVTFFPISLLSKPNETERLRAETFMNAVKD